MYDVRDLPTFENAGVEYLGGEPAGRHDRGRRYRSRTIWWCGRKRIGEFLFHANAATVIGVPYTKSFADNFDQIGQCGQHSSLLNSSQY